MRLESVRELKAEILSTTLQPRAVARAYTALLHEQALPEVKPPQILETVALGISRGRNQRDFCLAVRVQSEKLRFLQYIQLFEQIKVPHSEIDIRLVGAVHKMQWWQQRQRPLIAGISTGHINITAGTLGCFVKSRKNNEPDTYILSNNHVVAHENRAAKGDPIVQPGPSDGGLAPADTMAALHRFKALVQNRPNLIDAGIATVDRSQSCQQLDLSPFDQSFGKLKGIKDADIGQQVAKFGRTTGFTLGRVSAIEVDNVVVGFDIGSLRFDNQIEIESIDKPFCRGGDSGSIIMTKAGKAIGLLFAGSDKGGAGNHGLTYANPIETVFDTLGIDLL